MDVARVDKDDIAISNTYDGSESDENGTTSEWVDERVVVVMKMVLNELDLVDEHLDVLDLGIFDYLNT